MILKLTHHQLSHYYFDCGCGLICYPQRKYSHLCHILAQLITFHCSNDYMILFISREPIHVHVNVYMYMYVYDNATNGMANFII
jgi:hypothetical protein